MIKKRNIYVELAYLLFLGATLGGVLVLGIMVAPVIFNSDNHLTMALLDHYNEGLLMGEIFHRFSYWIYVLTAVVALYEVLEYRALRRDAVAQAATFGVLATGLMFSAVYTPKILEMQSLGSEATTSEAFEALHIASEIDFKILAFALALLFVRRVMLLRTIKS
ncbi:MAG: DUF4149 domain-containing protein [Campylobacterota bacterium]|nr:DUF4149 domain-containing protein [Campylobacterota bacterium]